MMWQETVPALDYTGRFGQEVGKSVALLQAAEFREWEYYTRVILAKAYTFLHVGATASLLLGMLLFADETGLLIAGVGIVASFVLASGVLKEPAKQVEDTADNLTLALPNTVTKLALLINSGMILREAWFYVAEDSEGEMAEYMKKSCERMENGYSELDAIFEFGNSTTSKEIKKLSSVILQGMEKGNAELSGLLMQQANELWAMKRQRMLQKGEEAATKLVFPTMLMFVGLILVIIVSSMSGLSL